MMRLRQRSTWIPIILLWIFSLTLSFRLVNHHPIGAGDFKFYHRGAARILNGEGLYDNLNPAYDYVGPALVVQMVLPLVAAVDGDFRLSANLWLLVNIAALLISFAMIAHIYPAARRSRWYWGAAALSMSVIYSMWGGQVTPIMFLFTVGAWYCYHKGYRIAAGALLAIIVWTKFYPGLLIVYFLWKRDWRVVISAVVSTVLVIVFQMGLVGFDGFVSFFREVLPPLLAEGQPWLNHSNNSVLGFAQKLFSPAPNIEMLVESPLLVSLTRYSLTLLLLFSVFFLSRQPMKKTALVQFDLEYSLALVVAMLLGSTLGVHGMLSAMLPMAVLGYGISRRALADAASTAFASAPSKSQQRVTVLGVALAYLLINLHIFIIVGIVAPGTDNTAPALLLSLPFFGMMLLWALLVYTLVRLSPFTKSSPSIAVSASLTHG